MVNQEVEKVDEKKFEKQLSEFRPMPSYSTALVPKGFKEAMEMAVVLAKSNVVPKEVMGRPESCFVAIGFGMELGLPPLQAIQNIMVVNGRPSIWGDAALALVNASGQVASVEEHAPHIALKQGFGRCIVTMKNGAVVERQFSIEDAKRAKLWTKEGPWQTYPGRMLQMRARSWAIRDAAPQVLKGIQFREEMQDMEVIHPPVAMPKAVNAPRNVQDATLVAGSGDTPTDTPNAQPERNASEIPVSESEQTTGDIPNEGQEPGNAPDDTAQLRITEERRKELFKIRSQAKVSLEASKAWLAHKGLKDTSELTNAQAAEFEAWIAEVTRDLRK